MSSPRTPLKTRERLREVVPGLLVLAGGVATALVVAGLQGLLGALVIALVLGAVLGNSGLYTARLRPGIGAGAKRLLRAGVVLLGLQLALPDILALGPQVIALVVVCVAGSFYATWWLGLRLGLSGPGALLLAAGFSICGASAIAAMQGVVNADEDEVGSAVAMVTLYGSLMILVLPLANTLIGLEGRRFGIWSGLAVHDVAQVVVVASTAGTTALAAATVVKLGRVVMLAPVTALTALARRRPRPRTAGDPGTSRTALPVVPLFVLGFLGMVVLRFLGVVPPPLLDAARTGTTVLLAAGMFGLGAGIDVGRLLRSGGRVAVVGAASTLLLGGTSLLGVLLLS